MARRLGSELWLVACLSALWLVAGCESVEPTDGTTGDAAVTPLDVAPEDAGSDMDATPADVTACQVDDDCLGAELELGTCAKPVCDLDSGECVVGYADDGDDCEDGDACTDGDTCAAGKCIAGDETNCDDENQCTSDTCDILSGCMHTPTDEPCEDGNPCTDGDLCAASECVPGGATNCDDGNSCTTNYCDAAAGCQAQPLPGVACSTGDGCIENSTCSDLGVCEGGSPADCDDGNECTTDSCTAEEGCINAFNTNSCDDGDPCTEKDFCEEGACAGGEPPSCDDENPCTTDGCDSDSGCFYENNIEPCDDQLFCTESDVCADGECTGAAVLCDDGDPCTTDACDEATDGCLNSVAGGTPCDDGSPCTVIDECKESGVCVGVPVVCDDENTCTADYCDLLNAAAPCQYEPIADKPCNDGDGCTINNLCNGETGACEGDDPLPCDDANSCTFDSCNADGEGDPCVHTPIEGKPCNDGNACTTNEVCQVDGACGGGDDVTPSCDDGLPCTFDFCDPTNVDEPCQHDTSGLEGSFCDDLNACTAGETCLANGSCGEGSDISSSCDDDNPCTDDSCDPDAAGNPCKNDNNNSVCDDGSACTLGDACSAGECVSGANVCECEVDAHCGEDTNLCNGKLICDVTGQYGPKNKCIDDPTTAVNCDTSQDTVCTSTVCETAFNQDLGETVGQCVKKFHEGSICNDGDECTATDTCTAQGACEGAEKECSDGNPCTDDTCNSNLQGGCTFPANSAPCEDGLFCTSGDTCADKQCKPGQGLDCDDGNLCTTDICSIETDSCKHLPKTNTPCDDGDVCTEGSSCTQDGECGDSIPVLCEDGDACTADACDSDVPGGCVAPVAVGLTCDDSNQCTFDDACQADGTCVGADKACDDLDPCTLDTCQSADLTEAPCQHELAVGGACDDGNSCTENDVCNYIPALPEMGLVCFGQQVECDDQNPCTQDSCDASLNVGCAFEDEDPTDCTFCQSDDDCEGLDICVSSQCEAYLPEDWTCNAEYYSAGDDCDCECGAYDPDCDDPTQDVVGCAPYSKCLQSGLCEALPPTCTEYCDKVVAHCTGGDAQYESHEACVSYCQDAAALSVGTAGDTNGNSIACRIHFAELAESDPAANCDKASASGGNTCGSWCENMCDLEAKNCTDIDDLYTSEVGCLSKCVTFSSAGEPGDVDGDTVQCRIHQLGTPAYADSEVCPAGTAGGGGLCVGPNWTAPTCTEYCDEVQTNCTGDNQVYDSDMMCSLLCNDYSDWNPGQPGDTSGNTLHCRIEHSELAAVDPAANCGAAGQSGNNTCGTWCENYCHATQNFCTGANMLYADLAACHTACQAFPTDGEDGDSTGDSVQCRITSAWGGSVNPEESCPAAAPDGGGTCVDPEDVIPNCSTYCDAIQGACTGENAQYENDMGCQMYCFMSVTWDAGNLAQNDVNTIGCREHHALLAQVGDTATNCASASPSGGGQCGSWCENYCQLAMANCTGGNALYNSEAACLTSCADFDDTGETGASSGDSVQCRITYAGKAGGFGVNAATTCANAAVDGGEVCVGEITTPLLINEIDYDQDGEDTAEFIELVNTTSQAMDLTPYTVELVSGADSSVYKTFDLSTIESQLGPGDYLVIGSESIVAGLPEGVVSMTTSNNFIQNGSNGGDAVQVLQYGNSIDSASYEAVIVDLTEGSGSAGTDLGPGSLSRCPDGEDTDDNAVDYQVTANTSPGQANDCACGDGVCGPEENCESCSDDCGVCEGGNDCVEWAAVEAILGDTNHGCLNCHSDATQSGGLSLATFESAKAGGNHGPAVVDCDPMASYLYLKPGPLEDWPPAVDHFGQQMPLGNNTPLSETELAEIYNWIADGAQKDCEDPDFCAAP